MKLTQPYRVKYIPSNEGEYCCRYLVNSEIYLLFLLPDKLYLILEEDFLKDTRDYELLDKLDPKNTKEFVKIIRLHKKGITISLPGRGNQFLSFFLTHNLIIT